MPTVYIPARNQKILVEANTRLLDALKLGGVFPDAVCGGNGKCGKCRVIANGTAVLSCKTTVEEDMTVVLPEPAELQVLQTGISSGHAVDPVQSGFLLAVDIGTTSVACYLLDGNSGVQIAGNSAINPQVAFGADVISRIQAALRGELPQLTAQIREQLTALIRQACAAADISPDAVGVVSVVGNPAMQQLFLGIHPENLSKIPFAPVLRTAKTVPCKDFLPVCPHGQLLLIPNISGYVGADTIGCLLATELYQRSQVTLLVDIGTNGEMVLGNKDRMIACATAAGPALEGANIRFGMRAAKGAIDHVWLENGSIRYSVIDGEPAKGICGSGLIDAIAVGLQTGLINCRGRIQNEDHIFRLTEDVYLTQEDIRQVQLAKGAICAGILLMADRWGLDVADIQNVQLAGAFGSFLDPKNACRIGLLPEVLRDKIQAVGNAAGSGAKMLACDKNLLPLTEKLAEKVEFVELANLPSFSKTFAKAMSFREEPQ